MIVKFTIFSMTILKIMQIKGARMSETKPQWHNYDQGLLYQLGQDPSGNQATQFAEYLGKELGTDLFEFEPGFKVVHTPFSLLEAIGLTSFSNPAGEIMPAVIRDFKEVLPEIKEGNKTISELPMIVVKLYQQYFRARPELTVANLIDRGESQIANMPNPVIAGILEHTIRFPIEELKSIRSQLYHDAICDYLALEYTQEFPYYDFLSKDFPDNAQRVTKTEELYHAFFQMAEDAIATDRNLSYFRSLDRARNIFSIHADAKARKAKMTLADPYRIAKAYLENNKDYLDSYLVHFSICGFVFEGQSHKTLSFTFDTSNVIRNRISYGLAMLHWINDCKGHRFKLNPGVVYCFDRVSLKIIDKIDVAKVEYTPISRDQTRG